MRTYKRLNPDARAALTADIETLILSGRWCLASLGALAEKYECAKVTVTRQRMVYEAMQRRAVARESLDSKRDQWWVQWQQAFDMALRNDDTTAAGRLLASRARVLDMEHAPIQGTIRMEVETKGGGAPTRAELIDDCLALPADVLFEAAARKRGEP